MYFWRRPTWYEFLPYLLLTKLLSCNQWLVVSDPALDVFPPPLSKYDVFALEKMFIFHLGDFNFECNIGNVGYNVFISMAVDCRLKYMNDFDYVVTHIFLKHMSTIHGSTACLLINLRQTYCRVFIKYYRGTPNFWSFPSRRPRLLFPMGVILWWAWANPSGMPNLTSLASAIV